MDSTFRPHIIASRHTLPQGSQGSGYDGYTEVVSLSIEMPRSPSISDVKSAISEILYFKENCVRMRMNYGPYDCTGQHFTTGLDQLRKFTHEDMLTYTFIHSIGIDV